MAGHCDPELLALRALGEPVDAEAAEHLLTCPLCAADLVSLQAVVRTGRELGTVAADPRAGRDAPPPAQVLAEPPPDVWARITAELTTGNAHGTDHGAVVPEPATDELAAAGARRRPARRWVGTAAAAVAGLAIGSIGTAVVMRSPATSVPQASQSTQVIGHAELAALPGQSGSGTAVMTSVSGTRHLRVQLHGLSAGSGYLEVWLMDPATGGLVALGTLVGGSGDYVVPGGLDLATYPAVDVSREPYDGIPVHAHDSVVRGTMDA